MGAIASAARDGDDRDLLVALRDRLAEAIDDPECPKRDLAALTRRLQDTVKEISAYDAQAREDADDAAVTPDEVWEAV